MVSFDKIGLGSLAFAAALASSSAYAATSPRPTSTPQVTAKGSEKDNIVLGYFQGDSSKVDHVTAHDTVERQDNTGYLVFWDKQNRILGKYDNVAGKFIPPAPTPQPRAVSTTVPARAPTTVARAPARTQPAVRATAVPVQTPLTIPTTAPANVGARAPVVSATPRPSPSGVPIILSGRGSISGERQTVYGTLWDGSGWRDVYTGARLDVRDLGLRTDNITKYLNGLFLLDGNVGTGSIKGLESGSYHDGRVVARVLADLSYASKTGPVGRFAIGPAAEYDRSRFIFPGGRFGMTSIGAGLEAVVGAAAKDGSMSGGLRARYLSLSNRQSVDDLRFSSRSHRTDVTAYIDVPNIEKISVHAEAGLENDSQRGDSGQGNSSQGVAKVLAEIGFDAKGTPVYITPKVRWVGLQPANVGAYEVSLGLGARFSTIIGYRQR